LRAATRQPRHGSFAVAGARYQPAQAMEESSPALVGIKCPYLKAADLPNFLTGL